METGDKIQLALLIITIIGLFITTIINIKQTKKLNKQMKLNFYTDYTKRYKEIILNFPENVNNKDFKLKNFETSEYNKIMRYMRAYFDLCYEEFNLNNQVLLEEETWKDWEEGMQYAFKKPAFKQAWDIIHEDTLYSKDFDDFVSNYSPKNTGTKLLASWKGFYLYRHKKRTPNVPPTNE